MGASESGTRKTVDDTYFGMHLYIKGLETHPLAWMDCALCGAIVVSLDRAPPTRGPLNSAGGPH